MSHESKKGRLPKERDRQQRAKAAKGADSIDALANSDGRSIVRTVARSERGKTWLVAAALVLAVFLAYQPAWHGGYVWDDDTHLLNNPVLMPGGLVRAWLQGDYINYWPLTFTVYRIEYDLWGLNPLGFHLVNIALHCVSAILVWRILTQLRIPGALFAAAIFALHPVNVESVAWIAQLKNVLSLSLALLSVLFYLLYERDRRRRQFALSIGFFLLSALAKGMMLTLPIVLLACVWWQRGRIERRDLLRVLPFLLIAGLMVGIELSKQHVGIGNVAVRSDGIFARAAVAGCAVWFYFWKFLWPVNLSFVYPRWNISERDVLSYLPGLLLAALLATAWWRWRSWGRPVAMLMVCYVALLLPILGFADIVFMQYSFVADHYQYAATIVLAAAFAGLTATLGSRLSCPRWGRSAFCLGLLTILAVLTFRQSAMYTDIETLYRTTLDRNPGCWLVHNNLGVLLSNRREFDEAIEHFRDAMALRHDYADAHVNLGVAYGRLGEIDKAIAEFREALRINRDQVAAHSNLAGALALQNRFDEAIEQYRTVLEISPGDVPALNNLAWLLATCPKAAFRNGAEAVELAQRAVQASNGRDPSSLNTLAAAYAEAGLFSDAVRTARKSLYLAEQGKNQAFVERLKARIRLYEAKTPYREPPTVPKTSAARP